MSVQNVQPVLPTLYTMSSPNLSKVGDIAMELINFMFKNPGFTSSVNEHEMISFRRLNAMYGHEPDTLAAEMQNQLTGALAHYFPDGQYRAMCRIENKTGYAEDGTFEGNRAITISVVDANDVPVIPNSAINVNHDGSAYTVSFSKQ